MITDRYNGFIIILDKDIRDDDAQATINAIRQIKGVIDVQPNVVSPDESIAEARIKVTLWEEVYKLFWKKAP